MSVTIVTLALAIWLLWARRYVWVGVLAPAKTPKDATSQLAHWFTAAMKAPEIESKLVMLGYYPVGLCGADFRAHIKKQSEEYGRVIRDSNIKAE